MADTEDSTPAVWDPAAHGGAGGWVRRRPPTRPGVPEPSREPSPWAGPGQGVGSGSADDTTVTDGPGATEHAGVPNGAGGPDGADEEPTALLPRVPEPPMVRPYLPPSAGATRPATDLPLFRPDPAADARPQRQQQPQQPPAPPPAPAFPPPAYQQPGHTGPGHTEPGYPGPGYAGQGHPQSGYPQSGYPQPSYVRPAQPGYQPPPGPEEPAEPARRISTPLLVLAVVVAAALIGGLAVWGLGLGGSSGHAAAHGSTPPLASTSAGSTPAAAGGGGAGSGSAAPPSGSASGSASAGTGQSEATAVDQLLGQSASSRQQVIDAVAAVAQCGSPGAVAAAQTTLTQAATSRRTLVTQLGAIDVSRIQGGAAAVQVLSKAWTESAAADSAYAAWAGDLAAGGCTPGNSPQNTDYTNGSTQSGLASADKNTFIDLWTPIAMQYGLPTRTADAI